MKNVLNQNGVALLTVLLATALIAVLSVGMTTEQQVGVRRTENLFESDQAMLLARGIEEWSVKLMERDLNGSNTDHLSEDWAIGLLPTPVGNGMVVGTIEDLQGRININNLRSPNLQDVQVTIDRLEVLYDICDMDPLRIDALRDWLDDDDQKRRDGAEDEEYLLKEPPYRAANRPMTSISELLLVEGVTEAGYRCIRGSIAALRTTSFTTINVNTAGVMVIAAVGNISIPDAEQVVKDREKLKSGYTNLNDFLSHPKMASAGTSHDLGLESEFFQVNGTAVFGRSEVTLYSTLARDLGRVRIVNHSIGAY